MNEIKVPVDVELIITAHVQKIIAEALGKDPTVLIQTVVEAALKQRSGTYGDRTVFGEAVTKMIQETAKFSFKSWLEGNKVLIEQAIEKRLSTEKTVFVQTVANKIVEGLASSFYVSVGMKVD